MEGKFLLVEGIQKTKFDTVILIDASAGNDPMRQQSLANITSYKFEQRCHCKRTALTELTQA